MKKVKSNKGVALKLSENGSDRQPTHDEIASHAHSIWVSAGRPHHYDLDCWLKAETELRLGQQQASARA